MGWSNWSGSVTAPVSVARPRDEGELAALVREAKKVRAVGAGHSFMPLCASDERIVRLADMTGMLTVPPDRQTARITAGWTLRRLTAAPVAQGLGPDHHGDPHPTVPAGPRPPA